MSSVSKTNEYLIAHPTGENEDFHVESQIVAASSSVYQSIDEQFNVGKLTSTEVAMYKARYLKLHNALKRTRDNEFNLIQLTKRFTSHIENQQSELSKADLFPDNALTVPSQLRAQILSHYNTAMETDERVEMLLYEAGLLREERKLLSRDYSRLPTSEIENLGDDVNIIQEMERRFKLLQGQCQELWLEIDVLKMEGRSIREQYRKTAEAEQELYNEHIQTFSQLNDVKAKWVISTDLPGQYSKETEKARKYKLNAEKELQTLKDEYTELQLTQANFEQMLKQAEVDKENLSEELSTVHQTILDRKKSIEDSTKLFENWFEMEMMNRTEKAQLLQRALLADQSKKELLEEIGKTTKERDSVNKLLRNLTTSTEVVQESLKLIKQIHNRTRARYFVTPKYDGGLMTKKRNLEVAIQLVQNDLQEEHQRVESEHAKTSECVTHNQHCLEVLEYIRAENWELLRLITNLTDSVSKAGLEYTYSRKKYNQLTGELLKKNVEITEQVKKLQELNGRLMEVSKCYAKAKLERNNLVGLLQTSLKIVMDTRERLKLHTNEAEILMFNLQKRGQQITKERKLFASVIVQHNHKRHQVSKLSEVIAKQLQKHEQLQTSIQQINTIYNQTEVETLSIRKAKERSARLRNEKATQLIERNQEVYKLRKRISEQATARTTAELNLHGLEEEINLLKIYQSQLSNYIQVMNKNGPKIEAMKSELRGLIHQLIASRVKLSDLICRTEDPDSKERLRILGGKDPSHLELWMTLGQLERRMAAKEENLAEKNLTYEAVCRLVDSLQIKVKTGKDDTLTLATEVNKVKYRLQQCQDQMKTLYAELIVTASERNRMRDYIEQLEHHLDLCKLRKSNGQAHFMELESIFLKQSNIERMKKGNKLDKPSSSRRITPMRPPGTLPNGYKFSSKGYDNTQQTENIIRNLNTVKIQNVNKNQSAEENQRGNGNKILRLPSLSPVESNAMKRTNQTDSKNVQCPEITY